MRVGQGATQISPQLTQAVQVLRPRLARHQATTLTNHFERSGKVGDDGAPIEVEKSWPVQARPAA